MKSSLALLVASFAAVAAGQTPPPTSLTTPQLTLREMLCGRQGLPPTSAEIPSIGCFTTAATGTARTVSEGHQYVVTVDAGGEPKCRFDGEIADCNGCVGQAIAACPVKLMVVSHNADRSVSFSVQRHVGGNRYVNRVDAWDRYLEQKQSHQEAEAAQTHAPLPTLPSSAVEAPSIPGPPPPGMFPGSVAPTDGPAALAAVGWQAQGAYGSGQFAKLDALIETLSQPDQTTDDGMPRLQGVYDGLWSFMNAYKDWQVELDKIAEWRKEYPDSCGADLVEVILWRAWAWHARGEGDAETVTPEGWKLFRDKILSADGVLERSKGRASKSPLWYQLSLGIARDAGWDHQRYRALFNEGTKKYPWYVPLYLWAANYLSPKWGGSYEMVDALARLTTTTPLGADYSLYARVYWHLTCDECLEFGLYRDSPATWPRMKTGFEGLMNRYPKSKWNLNGYAYFACLANDAQTYGVLRAQIGKDLIPEAWGSNHSAEVCDEHLFGHT
jgi:hypothetical protein